MKVYAIMNDCVLHKLYSNRDLAYRWVAILNDECGSSYAYHVEEWEIFDD